MNTKKQKQVGSTTIAVDEITDLKNQLNSSNLDHCK